VMGKSMRFERRTVFTLTLSSCISDYHWKSSFFHEYIEELLTLFEERWFVTNPGFDRGLSRGGYTKVMAANT